MTTAVIIKIPPKRTPGRNPARKTRGMDSSVMEAYMIIGMLGGIKMPRLPEAQAKPIENRLSYPNSTIEGTITDPTAMAVAGLEPEIEAKNMQDRTVTIPRPPGKWPTRLSKKSTKWRDGPPAVINIPQRRKKGIDRSEKLSMLANIT